MIKVEPSIIGSDLIHFPENRRNRTARTMKLTVNDLIAMSNAELERFLLENLPRLSGDWWTKLVVSRLSFQQQRLVKEKDCRHLRDLDFAALLRVLDQNWYELSALLSLPREARHWLKELQ